MLRIQCVRRRPGGGLSIALTKRNLATFLSTISKRIMCCHIGVQPIEPDLTILIRTLLGKVLSAERRGIIGGIAGGMRRT